MKRQKERERHQAEREMHHMNAGHSTRPGGVIAKGDGMQRRLSV